jgi:tRNA A37 threonylcarbamoyladenosine biosynthesis protein TsaE
MSGQVEKTLMLLSYHPDANKVLDDFSVKATLVLITGDLPAGKTKMKIRCLKVVN